MRVLFVSPFAGLGGAERCLLDMLAALGSAAPQIERRVLLMSEGPLTARVLELGAEPSVQALPAELLGLGESGHALRAVGALARRGHRIAAELISYARSFRGSLAELRPDVVHTNGIKAHILA